MKNAVFLNEQTFLSLKQLIQHLVTRLSSGKIDNFIQVALLGALKILKTNLLVLRTCKVPISDLLEPSDLQKFRAFSRDCLDKIEDYGEDDIENSVEVKYQKVILWHTKELSTLLDQVCNSDAPITKLNEVVSAFEKAKGDADTRKHVMILLSAISNPRSIRETLRGSSEEISRTCDAYKLFLDFYNDQVLEFLSNDALESLEKEDTFMGRVNLFIKDFTEVVLVQYGLFCQEIEETSA